jgi:hypothetical protein
MLRNILIVFTALALFVGTWTQQALNWDDSAYQGYSPSQKVLDVTNQNQLTNFDPSLEGKALIRDTIVDNGPNLSAIADRASEQGNITLYFPTGTYYLMMICNVKPGIKYLGDGSDKTIIQRIGVNDPLRNDLGGDFMPHETMWRWIQTGAIHEDTLPLEIEGIGFDGNNPRAVVFQFVNNVNAKLGDTITFTHLEQTFTFVRNRMFPYEVTLGATASESAENLQQALIDDLIGDVEIAGNPNATPPRVSVYFMDWFQCSASVRGDSPAATAHWQEHTACLMVNGHSGGAGRLVLRMRDVEMSNVQAGQGLSLGVNVDVEVHGMKSKKCYTRGGILIQGGWSKVKLRDIEFSDGSWFHMEFDGGAGYEDPVLGPMYVEMDFENIASEDALTFTVAGVSGSNPNSTFRIKNWQHAGLRGHVLFTGVWNSHNQYVIEDSTFRNAGWGNSHFRNPGYGGFLFRNCEFVAVDRGQKTRVSAIPKAMRRIGVSEEDFENQLIQFVDCKITAEEALFESERVPIVGIEPYSVGQNPHKNNRVVFINTEFDNRLDGVFHTGGAGSPKMEFYNCHFNPSTRLFGRQQYIFILYGRADNRLWDVTLKDCTIGPSPTHFIALDRDRNTTFENYLRMSGISIPLEQFPTAGQQFGRTGEGYQGFQYVLPEGGENPMLLITSQGAGPPDANVRGVCNSAYPLLAFTRFINTAGKSYRLIGMPSTWEQEAWP